MRILWVSAVLAEVLASPFASQKKGQFVLFSSLLLCPNKNVLCCCLCGCSSTPTAFRHLPLQHLPQGFLLQLAPGPLHLHPHHLRGGRTVSSLLKTKEQHITTQHKANTGANRGLTLPASPQHLAGLLCLLVGFSRHSTRESTRSDKVSKCEYL